MGARTNRDGLSVLLFFAGAAEYEPGQSCTMQYVPVVEESAIVSCVFVARCHRPVTA